MSGVGVNGASDTVVCGSVRAHNRGESQRRLTIAGQTTIHDKLSGINTEPVTGQVSSFNPVGVSICAR